MSKIHLLKAEERLSVGTGPSRELRRNKLVPATIYGAGKSQVLLSLPEKELNLEYRKQGFLSHMFDIEVAGKKYRALPKEVQLHPVTDEIEHIDFMHIDANKPIKANVALHFINEAKCPGIKQGGVLNVVRHSLEIYCLPDNIPESIEFDAGDLGIGQSVHVKDLELPKNVETKMDLNVTIAAIVGGKASASSESESSAK
jgi:large subunit ribosomal protein L25